MAVTNLLDRLAEEYEGKHPVEYRAPLAKLGKTIGKIDYSLGGGTKGVSARDIIRKDIKGNGVGVYPFDVLEKRRNNKRKDDSMPWDYAIQSKDGGMLIDSFNGGTKADANEYMAQLKKKGIVPKDAKLVSNVSSSRQTAQQKRDLDEFKKAFEDVRAQRDEYNSLIDKGDILGHYQDLSSKKTNMKLKGALLSQETDIARKRGNNRRETAARTYGINDWKDFVAAKKAAKEAGQNLGRLFAEQNQREKNMYGNISKGLKPSTYAVPEGRYKYALGNQNHVYSASPDEPENDWMNLNPEYHGQPSLTNSGHEIHWRKDGTPIIDAYTWTQIPNIEKIKKTGYLAVEGSDTENFHPGTKGQWTSDRDNTPMGKNYDNDMHVGEVGPNGENFNEELLHSRLPLSWYQNAPVIHQGPRGGSYNVDVIQARPNAPEVMIGEGDRRRLEKVATPAQFINHITEDKMRPDWIMGRPAGRVSVPGWHPNKKDDVNLNDLNIAFNQAYKNYIGNPKNREKANLLLDAMKNPEMKNRLADYYKNTAYSNVSAPEIIKNSRQEYLNYLLEKEQSPYDFIQSVRQKPKVSEGSLLRPQGLLFWDDLNIGDFPRTGAFIVQKQLDETPIKDFSKKSPQYTSHPGSVAESILNSGNRPYEGLHGSVGGNYRFTPTRRFQREYIDRYLDNVGLQKLEDIKKERESIQGRSLFESPVRSETLDRYSRRGFYKSELDDNKESRSLNAANKLFYSNPRAHAFVRKNVSSNPKFGKLENFSFDDWFEDYMHNDNFYKDFYKNDLTENKAVQNAIAMEKERVRPFIDEYLDYLKDLPSDKELAKKAYERTKKKFQLLTPEEELEFLKTRQPSVIKADSLEKVIGHMIGRRIGADRAKRGKKIF